MLKKTLWVIIPLLIVGIAQAAIEYGLNKKLDRYTAAIQARQAFPTSITCTNKHYSWIPFEPEMSFDVTASGPVIAAGYTTGDVILKSQQISLKPDIFSKALTLSFTHAIDFQIPLPHSPQKVPMKINLSNLNIKAGEEFGLDIEGSDITALDNSKSKDDQFIFAIRALSLSLHQDKKDDSLSISLNADTPVLSSALLKTPLREHSVQVIFPSVESDIIAHGILSLQHHDPANANMTFNIRKLTLSYPPVNSKKRTWASITIQGKQDKKSPLSIPGIMPIAIKGYYYSPDFKAIADRMHEQQILADDTYTGLLSMLSATSTDVTKAVHAKEKVTGASFSIARGQIKINNKLIWDSRAKAHP